MQSRRAHLRTRPSHAPLTPSRWMVCPTTMRSAPAMRSVFSNMPQSHCSGRLWEYSRVQTTAFRLRTKLGIWRCHLEFSIQSCAASSE